MYAASVMCHLQEEEEEVITEGVKGMYLPILFAVSTFLFVLHVALCLASTVMCVLSAVMCVVSSVMCTVSAVFCVVGTAFCAVSTIIRGTWTHVAIVTSNSEFHITPQISFWQSDHQHRWCEWWRRWGI